MTEKRHFTRVHFDATASLATVSDKWDTKVIDISMKGALIEKPEAPLDENQVVELKLTLSDCSTQIVMEARVAHIDEKSVGLVCEHIDVDSISHLRRIVELNTGDESLLERELESLTHYTDRESFH